MYVDSIMIRGGVELLAARRLTASWDKRGGRCARSVAGMEGAQANFHEAKKVQMDAIGRMLCGAHSHV